MHYITYHGKKIAIDGATGIESKQILAKYTNDIGEFQHKNPRTHRVEHISLTKLQKFKKNKFGLMGKSPNDKRTISKLVHHS